MSFEEYIAHGWKLCRIEPGTKGPVGQDWSLPQNALRSADSVRGCGLLHAYSGTCAIDIDDLPAVVPALEEIGIDLLALMHADDAVRIERGDPDRTKLLYALPEPLPTIKPMRGLELRCGTRNGRSVQDVLPPSIHPSGAPYAWVYGCDLIGDWRSLPPLPGALRAYWERAASFASAAEAVTAGGVEPAELQRLLVKLDPDGGYDDWLRVGMAVHHATAGADAGLQVWDQWSSQGAKYRGFRDLVPHWQSFRTDGEHAVTVNTLRGLQTADPSEFDELEPVAPELANGTHDDENPYLFEPVAEWLKRPPPEWLLDGVLPQAELAMIYGASGSGKTFWALDVGLAMLGGEPWRKRACKRLAVGWIAAEAAGSVRLRTAAWMKARGCEAPPLFVNGRTPNLANRDVAMKVIEAVRAAQLDVVVIDTLAAASGGANENSGEDMNQVINVCRGIHRTTGALVLLIHHSGKDKSKGARGWSGIKAALDAEIEIEETPNGRQAVITKHRDGEVGEHFPFTLDTVAGSCVVGQLQEIDE